MKQVSPRAKGGFQENPQNINRKGRPPKGYSITEWFREMLNSEPEVKEAIGQSILKKALDGDSTAQKLVWQYMDGMPQQNMDITSGGNPLPILGGKADVPSNNSDSEDS